MESENYRHLYTSTATFEAKSRCCSVRLGPLPHVMRDDSDGSMKHRMMEGIYNVHRIGKTSNSNRVGGEELFTVIAAKEIDPIKVVKFVKCVSPTQDASTIPNEDVVFDNYRWCDLYEKPRPSEDYGQPGSVHYTATEEILCNDMDTFYVRLLSKRQLTDLRFTLCSPRLKEFVVSTESSDSTVVLGISHPGLSTNTRGYVLYTTTDLHGRILSSGNRAFAIVFGPKIDSADCFMSAGLTMKSNDFLYTDARRRRKERRAGVKEQSRSDGEGPLRPLRREKRKPIDEPDQAGCEKRTRHSFVGMGSDVVATANWLVGDGDSNEALDGCSSSCAGLPTEQKPFGGCSSSCPGLPTEQKPFGGCSSSCPGLPTEQELFDECNSGCAGLPTEQKMFDESSSSSCSGLPTEQELFDECNSSCAGLPTEQELFDECNSSCAGLPTEQELFDECNSSCAGLPTEQELFDECSSGLPTEQELFDECSSGLPTEQELFDESSSSCAGLPTEQELFNDYHRLIPETDEHSQALQRIINWLLE